MDVQENWPQRVLRWLLQVGLFLGFAPAAWSKLSLSSESLALFEQLHMGRVGVFMIGGLEALVCVWVLSPILCHWGALLGLALMLGALIAHITVLGFNSAAAYALSALTLMSLALLFMRRHRFPFFPSDHNSLNN